MAHSHDSLVDVLRSRVDDLPHDPGYVFLSDGELQEESKSYRDLDRDARAIAAALMARGAQPGDAALLLYAPGLDYIAGFFGCLYAGLIAVPAYPPDPSRLPRTLPRVQAIARDCGAKWALTTKVVLSMSELVFDQAPDLRRLTWLATDELDPGTADDWRPTHVRGDDLAFIQYTSGSTGRPKGVMLTHRNLVANAHAITLAFGIDAESRGVSWLPPYHDMGLIGGILQPLYAGRPTVLMSPLAFLRRPIRWLEAISRNGATISGAPNFAYELCIRKAKDEDIAGLDLRTWRVAFCGAEPVRAETFERFAERFADCGFRREAFYPCYGLAEATLLVSGGDPDTEPAVVPFSASSIEHGAPKPASRDEQERRLVSCGPPAADHEVVAVDPESLTRVPPDQVGELWVRGPSVARGYWHQEETTERVFHATLPDAPERRYLRTGDLGFFHGGEVFITGRLKDVIVIRGRNCYPEDIEMTVEAAHPALRPGCGAVFAVDEGGTERLVVIQELERRWRRKTQKAQQHPDRRTSDPTIDAFHPGASTAPAKTNEDFSEIIDAIRSAVSQQHDLQPFAVVLLKAGAVPKTSSGKVQRSACKRLYATDTLDTIHAWRRRITRADELRPTRDAKAKLTLVARPQSLEDVLPWLRERLAELLRVPVDEVKTDEPVTHYGIDSLQSVDLQNAVEARYGVALSSAALLRGPTLEEVAALVFEGFAKGEDGPVARSRTSQVEVSYAQERLWFLHQLEPTSTMYNISAAITMTGQLAVGALQQALNEIVRRHDVLRQVFSEDNGVPVATIQRWAARPLLVEDLGEARDVDAAVAKAMRGEATEPLDIERGPMIRWRLLRCRDDRHVLLVTMHHIVSDGWSVGVFARELGLLYGSLVNAETPRLPGLPIQYADYAQWERDRLRGEELRRGLAYWQRKLSGAPEALDLPRDRPRPPVQSFRGARHETTFGHQLADALHEVSKSEGVTLYMVLLAGFYALIHRYTGQNDLVVGCVSANRQRANVDRLIGFFANTLALRTDLTGQPTFRELLKRVSETTLEAYEHDFIPFERVVEAVSPRRDPSRNPLVQAVIVLQNAPMPALDLPGLEMATAELDTAAARFDLLVGVWKRAEGFGLMWEYATDLFDEETIRTFASDYEALLTEAVAAMDRPLHEIQAKVEPKVLTVAVTATFTADMIARPLESWLERFHLPTRVDLAPYNQVPQQLLDPTSLLNQVDAGLTIVLIRLEDLAHSQDHLATWAEEIEAAVEDLTGLLRDYLRGASVPCYVGLCPPSDAWGTAEGRQLHGQIAEGFLGRVQKIRGLRIVDLDAGARFYDVDRINEPFTDEMGHIPYSESAFVAFSACIARHVVMDGAQYRAIVVDPVDLIWNDKGSASAETPPEASPGRKRGGALFGPPKSTRRPSAVSVTPPQRRTQELLLRLRDAGMRLALCSSGEEATILGALRNRGKMPLMSRHFHGWRISKEPVADQLRALADDLQLPLQSIVFMSPRASVRAEVQAQVPDVLVLPVSGADFATPDVLANLWAYYVDDSSAATASKEIA